jgi:hypothetical protein
MDTQALALYILSGRNCLHYTRYSVYSVRLPTTVRWVIAHNDTPARPRYIIHTHTR